MDINRIKKILSSDHEFAVEYQGVPVWIKSIEKTSSMAVVSERGFNGEKQLVSIDALEEKGMISHN